MFAAFKFYKARAIMMEFHYKINKEKALDLQRENDGLRQQLQDFQNQDLEKKFNDATARAMKAESDLGVENSKIEILNKRLEETSSRVQEAQAQFELASTRANDVQTRLQLLSDKMSETENKFKREVAKGESLARDLIAERDQRILLNEQVRVCEVKIKELKLEVENGRAYTLRVRKDATTKIVQSFNSALDRVQADSSILNSRAVVPEAPPFKGNLPAP